MIERIVKLLRDNNMTAKQLTERLGINSSTVSEWKKGKTKPSVEHVRRMAEIFNVSTDYIINGTMRKPEFTVSDIPEELDYTMLDVFTRLSSKHKAAVRDFFYMCVREMENRDHTLEKVAELRSDHDADIPSCDDHSAEISQISEEKLSDSDTSVDFNDTAAYAELKRALYED